jgi:transketolase
MTTRRELANAIRALSMDAVQRANSGHPGMPMGMADIAQVLWCDFLRYNPGNPGWANRDRFVLSNGHGSMLLYSVLHLTGYPLTIADLESFRQLGSKTPGHPEYDLPLGIETTTGPLGQGLANAVGMAFAEKLLALRFNRPDLALVDHHTYAFCGDGCLMEGVSHEACSLAGTLGLGKLIVFYDDNGISIDGKVAGWFTDDTPGRFAAYGWHVIANVDGLDGEAVGAAIRAAREETERPSLICCKTIIGYGAPHRQGTKEAHGEALGPEEVAAARVTLGWPYPPFVVPDEIRAGWDHRAQGAALEAAWRELFSRYAQRYPDEAREFERRMRGELPATFPASAAQALETLARQSAAQATRASSQAVLSVLAPALPELFGGSADLTQSNSTFFKGARTVTPQDEAGDYLHYGVREFGMTAVMNGIALHGGLLPYGGTFLVFSDYARNAVRLACLMQIKVVLVYSHDSIGLGEDGPTHQPIEHLAALRAIPGLYVYRPADAVETAECWALALQRRDAPSLLALTRQALPLLRSEAASENRSAQGAYVLAEANGGRQLTLLATGSEVSIAMAAREALARDGMRAAVVSMPCWEIFEKTPREYRDAVLGSAPRVAVEAAVQFGWERWLGPRGAFIGMTGFGASAPVEALYPHFGITPERVAEAARSLL